MNAPGQNRGRHLTDRTKAPVGLTRLFARGFHKIIDRVDAGMEYGAIEGHLPDGTTRLVGGRGEGPLGIVHLHDWRALLRLARGGSAGWYEAWAAGEWESPDLVPLFDLFARNRVAMGNAARPSGLTAWIGRAAHFLRRNNRKGSRKNIEDHYDLGNDFYAAWLDDTMSYSSAMFKGPFPSGEKLEAAQKRKVETLLARLDLQDGQSLLEIGCGWGGLAEIALRKHHIHYHGITLSAEQKAFAEARLADAKLAENATITLTDYRDIAEQYDAIASVEMVEAVGQDYWPAYLRSIARALKPGGKAAIQYIRIEDDIFEAYARNADFIQRYIFPGGMLLSESRFRMIAENEGLQWRDQHDFGLHYAETLRRWRQRFDLAVEEGRLPAGFDSKFVALWRYYLMYCEGGFRGGGINVAQVTLVKE